MGACDDAHEEFGSKADGKVRVGTLPEWTRVEGKVAWQVLKGPYSKMLEAWPAFMQKALAAAKAPNGPPGDVYVCNPMDHHGKAEATMLTVLYLPVE
jgi:hypothetical protein